MQISKCNVITGYDVYNGYLFLQSGSLDVDCSGFGFKVFNATISVISLRAVLLVKETGVLYIFSSVAASCSAFDFDRQSLCIVYVCCYIHDVVMKKIPYLKFSRKAAR